MLFQLRILSFVSIYNNDYNIVIVYVIYVEPYYSCIHNNNIAIIIPYMSHFVILVFVTMTIILLSSTPHTLNFAGFAFIIITMAVIQLLFISQVLSFIIHNYDNSIVIIIVILYALDFVDFASIIILLSSCNTY